MAARRKTVSAPTDLPSVEDTNESEDTMPTDVESVVDDVVETETAAPAKRGRPADPTKAAMTRFAEARKALDEAQKPRPSVEDAQAEFDSARDALVPLLGL